MGENSAIEWTDHTFNPWWGCMKVSPGCKNCYAEKLDNRYHHDNPHWGPNSARKPMSESYWKQPIKWNKQAAADGVRRRVFCASMADVFELHPDTLSHRDRLFKLIEETPNLDWLLLTKRPENIMLLSPSHWRAQFPDNIWVMTSAENQTELETRVSHLITVPAKIRGLSCEPLLGKLDIALAVGKCFPIGKTFTVSHVIHWVIAGGESGPGARPSHPDWIRSLRDKCHYYGVAFFFKQWGEWLPNDQFEAAGLDVPLMDIVDGKNMFPEGDFINENNWRPGATTVYKVGKKASGKKLDGIIYQNLPLITLNG